MNDLPSALPLLLLLPALLSVPAWLWGPPLWRRLQRRRWLRRPFPTAWRNVLRRRMPAYSRLPAALQLQLKAHIRVFVAEKPFIGCAGLVVSDEMRVLVAAQACLLLLNGPLGGFPGLRQVLLYPAAFAVDRVQGDAAGLVTQDRQVLLGESWQQGQVVLSWADVVAGAADADDGHNVVIHEFAHQLDQADGAANGAPFLGGGPDPAARRLRRARWAATLGAAHAALLRSLAAGEPTAVGAHGASSPAEFFAAASESFFERPAALSAAQPALYAELAAYYRVDPRGWV